ncbi:hypothetical protein DAI22_07g206300 [Oryza sativa Japonica Group]|nr:hypothetical protein DAI22_07g206300 [Oryza sativa Japonica Group]
MTGGSGGGSSKPVRRGKRAAAGQVLVASRWQWEQLAATCRAKRRLGKQAR